MKIIAKKRGEGKTTDLICWSHLTGYPIVTPTYKMAEYTQHKAYEMSLNIPEPMCYGNYWERFGNGTYKPKILVDELQALLDKPLYNIYAATITISEEE